MCFQTVSTQYQWFSYLTLTKYVFGVGADSNLRRYADRNVCGEWLSRNHVHFCNHSQICKSAPVHRDGPNIYSTCGTACASKVPPPNTNEPRTSEPPNSAFMSSGLPRNNADTTRSHSRPNQMGMCDVSTLVNDFNSKRNLLIAC